MAPHCPVEPRKSPHQKKVHVKSKRAGTQVVSPAILEADRAGSSREALRVQLLNRESLSIPLPPKSSEL